MLLILGSICTGTVSQAGGDDTHPWPWGFEIQFPWDEVQGTWKAQSEGKTLYFNFRRIQTKRVKIQQIDLDSCTVVGTGQGFERNKTIVAQITTTRSFEPYNLTVYAFNEEDSPKQPVPYQVGQEHVIVARVSRFNHPGFDFVAQMVRISDSLELKCAEWGKKAKF
jgi:hypothetical protein